MTHDYPGPDISARRLGLYLRKIREFREWDESEAAGRLGCDVEWLIRVEGGFQEPTPAEVERMVDRYEVGGAEIANFIIGAAARLGGPPWLLPHLPRLKAEVRDVLIMESEASVIRSSAAAHVPRLVWSEAFVRDVIPHVVFDHVDEEVELMLARVRHRPAGWARRLDVIVDWQGIRSGPHGPMAGQLRHMLDLLDDPDVRIRVVPLGRPVWERRTHTFDILEFPEMTDTLAVAYSALGPTLGTGDLEPLWLDIEERCAASDEESRELLIRCLGEHEAG